MIDIRDCHSTVTYSLFIEKPTVYTFYGMSIRQGMQNFYINTPKGYSVNEMKCAIRLLHRLDNHLIFLDMVH